MARRGKKLTKAERSARLTFNGVLYKSGLKRGIAEGLTGIGVAFQYELEAWKYPYKVPGAVTCQECGSKNIVKLRKYTPDFFITGPKGGIVLETKGYLQPTDRTIIKHAKLRADELGVDYRILFERDNQTKLKKTPTYLSWAESIGMKAYAGPTFPTEILRDLGYE